MNCGNKHWRTCGGTHAYTPPSKQDRVNLLALCWFQSFTMHNYFMNYTVKLPRSFFQDSIDRMIRTHPYLHDLHWCKEWKHKSHFLKTRRSMYRANWLTWWLWFKINRVNGLGGVKEPVNTFTACWAWTRGDFRPISLNRRSCLWSGCPGIA